MKLLEIELHLFGDATIIGTSAVAFTVVKECSSTTQGFISNKSHPSKKNTSAPRLELFADGMVANLAKNIQNLLINAKITTVHGWSDNWINGNETYK